MQEINGDKITYLIYYVRLVGIKEVINDEEKSLYRAGNRTSIPWPSAPLATLPIEEFW